MSILKKIAATASLALTASAFYACSDVNPIEAFNEDSGQRNLAENMESLENNIKASAEKGGSSESGHNTENGTQGNSSSSGNGSGNPGGSSGNGNSGVEPESSSSEAVNYLLENKVLTITFESYKQQAEVMAPGDTLGDPDIRFKVTAFSDDLKAYSKTSAMVLSGQYDIKEWTKAKSVSVDITKGIDKIQICPIVIEKNDENDDDISPSSCVTIKNLGLAGTKTSDQVEDTDADEKYTLSWSWTLK